MDNFKECPIKDSTIATIKQHAKEEAAMEKNQDESVHNSKSKQEQTQMDLKFPTISLSDGESEPAHTKIEVKRKSLGADTAAAFEEENNYRLKQRKIRVAGAPKMPLNGYVRYMNERREILRKEQPTKTAMEHTKIIGEEWHLLSENRRTPYMEAAELDKQRYLSELHNFLKEHPDVLACELAKNKSRKIRGANNRQTVLKNSHDSLKSAKEKSIERTPSPQENKIKSKRTPTPTSTTSPLAGGAQMLPGEIPIFTNEFLEHNKNCDTELRTMRKCKADLEQQNAVLERHVENMKIGVEKMTNENDELEMKNRLLEVYLNKMKRKLVIALADLAIPTEPHGATMDNIDKYMEDLYKMATSNTHGPACLNKAKDIIRKLDLQIHL